MKQNDQTTVLNFFFRENFNLVKLHQTQNRFFKGRADFTGLQANLKKQIQQQVRNNHPWLFGRRLRKLTKRNLLLVSRVRFNCLVHNSTNFNALKNYATTRDLIDFKLLSRGKRLQAMQKSKTSLLNSGKTLCAFL